MRDPDKALSIGRLKRRADFLRAAKGKRWHGKALGLQVLARDVLARDVLACGDAEPQVRVGFTLTRKVGGAVIRNRARRRLKEALRLGDIPFEDGHDYVVIGRIEALRQPFEALKAELARAVTSAGKSSKPTARLGRAATPRPETTRIDGSASKTDRPPGTGP